MMARVGAVLSYSLGAILSGFTLLYCLPAVAAVVLIAFFLWVGDRLAD